MIKIEWTPGQVLTALETAGISLRVEGGRLIVHPKSKLTPSLVEAIKEHRDELVALLSGTPSDPVPPAPAATEDGDAVQPVLEAASTPVEGVETPAAGIPEAGASVPAPDLVTTTLEVVPSEYSSVIRTAAPIFVRLARRRGLGLCLTHVGCLVLSAPAEVWAKCGRLISWIEEHTAAVAEVLSLECAWCGKATQLTAGRFCDEKCKALAAWKGWIPGDEEGADKARGDE